MKKWILCLLCGVMLMLNASFALTFDELKTQSDLALQGTENYATTLQQLHSTIKTCSVANGNPAQELCKQRLQEAYPDYLQKIPVQRAVLKLDPKDMQLKKIKTQLVKKDFRFLRGPGGWDYRYCPSEWKVWLDLWEVSFPSYGFKTQFRYFNPTKNPKLLRSNPECDYDENFWRIIPLKKWQWLHNNSIRIPTWNATSPEFFDLAYIEYATPNIMNTTSRKEIKATYLNVYKDLFQVQDLKEIEDYFDEQLMSPISRSHEAEYTTKKNQLFWSDTLPRIWEVYVWRGFLTGDIYSKYAVDAQPVYTYCRPKKNSRRDCENQLDKYWGDLVMYLGEFFPYRDEEDQQKIKVLVKYSPHYQLTFL